MAVSRLFLRLTTPVQKTLQQTGEREALVTVDQVRLLQSLVQQGDILGSYEEGRPTSRLIRGYYDHAAIVTSNMTVMEAVGDLHKKDSSGRHILNSDGSKKNFGGVVERDLTEWAFKKDSLFLIRPLYETDINNKIAAANSFHFKGYGYDYEFAWGNERIYCSELVKICYVMTDPYFMNHIPPVKQVLPQDFYDASEKFPERYKLILELKNT